MGAPIYTPDTSGIAQGLSKGLSFLNTALTQRMQQNQQQQQQQQVKQREFQRQQQGGTILQGLLADLRPDATLQDVQNMGAEAISQGVDANVVKQFLAPYEAQFKEEQKIKGQKEFMELLGFGSQGTGGQGSQQEPLSPIKEVNEFEKSKPGVVEKPDNRLARSVTGPDGQQVTQKQIDLMTAAPYEGIRRLGESYQNQLNEATKSQMKENVEIRKEERKKISDFIKPFQDISEMKKHVGRFKAVQRLITRDAASYDDDFWRITAQALLEDKGNIAMSEILKTDAQQKMYALLRPYLATKEIGGSNPSTREVLLSLAALPSGFKGKGANEYIGQLFLNEAEVMLKKSEISNEITRNKNITFNEFQSQLSEQLDPMIESKQNELQKMQDTQLARMQIKGKRPHLGYKFMMSPDGKPVEVNERDIENAIQSGGVLLNE